ncbi:MAG: hypothetical protein RR161_00090 [Bacilli bacterium]
MEIIKEEIEVDEVLNKKINNILRFNNIKSILVRGSIISITKTNLAYIEPHKLEVNNITYLFFNECDNVYINNLENYISIKELENYLKKHS